MYRSPERTSPLAYTGTVALALAAIQMLSGLLLAIHYAPHADKAFASVLMIRNEVPLGFFFTTLHTVGAKLLILVLFVHLFRLMLRSAQRRPDRSKWYLGMLAFAAVLLSGFSGNLLPWSQQSYWSCVISTEAFRAVPLLGNALVRAIRGGEMVTGVTLHRFYELHVFVLPILIVSLSVLHVNSRAKIFTALRKNGIVRLRAVTLGLIALFFSVFFLFSAFLRHRSPADPLVTPDNVKPEWYFLAPYQLLKEIPNGHLALALMLALALLVFFLPALDSRAPGTTGRRPAYLLLVIAGIVGFVALTVMGWF